MFCGKCGKENEPGARFCGGCGQPLDYVGNVTHPSMPQVDVNRLLGKIKEIPKATIALFAIVALLLVFVVGPVVYVKMTTIELDDYLTIETSGYDGYGSAKATIDWKAIEEDYGSRASMRAPSMMSPYEILRASVYVSLDSYDNLSNGDTITYQWHVAPDLFFYVDCKLNYNDGTYQVSDLEYLKPVDVFEGITVEYSGIEPHGTATLVLPGNGVFDERYAFDYNHDPTLSNGDTLTVSFNERTSWWLAENKGMKPKETVKRFTVEGLSHRLTDLQEMTEKGWNYLQATSTQEFNAYVEKNFDEGEELESFDYIGNFFCAYPANRYHDYQDWLFLVFRVRVHDQYSNEGNSYDEINTFYWYVRFDDILLGADGRLETDELSYDVLDYDPITFDSGVDQPGYYGTKCWSYTGEETVDALYQKALHFIPNDASLENNVKE